MSSIVKGDRVIVRLAEGNPWTGKEGKVIGRLVYHPLYEVMVDGDLLYLPETKLERV